MMTEQRQHVLLAAFCVAAACRAARGFYLPGVAPIEYDAGAKVELKVNKLTSVKTQLPYSYYVLPYCRPKEIQGSIENLGEILVGDVIENSPYEVLMLKNTTCKVLCDQPLKKEQKDQFRSMVDDEYLVNWMVDNLPAATQYSTRTAGLPIGLYTIGFPVGIEHKGRYFINNHVRLSIQYHSQDREFEGYRIVGFEVEPRSIGTKGSCNENNLANAFDLDQHDEIRFSYDVEWTYSPNRWVSRWDNYLKVTAGHIHWFSILNSLMIMVFLSGMVAIILLRTLYRDITRYNEVATSEEAAEETGWKLVHGDVFRKPPYSKLFAVSVASGTQILGMSVVTLICALLGFLSPEHRGALLQSMMVLFAKMGILAGYTQAKLYNLFQGEDWKLTTLLTALLYPGILFVVFFVLNLFIWGQKSSGAVPFLTLFAVLLLWFGISVPLVFVGSYLGYRSKPIELPVRTNQVPRQIPEQQWFLRPVFAGLIGGILPFGAVFTELFFIMSSLWHHQFYYLFGFLGLVLVILIITCAEISVALTYFQLTTEDYHWWWRSFLTSGFSAVYVFFYSILYFSTRLQIEKTVSTMLYFGYMFMISLLFFLLTGSIGTLASFQFVRHIYGSIKID
mmetsp:Transcript_3504/g.6697  ORF Transcript_3504/g.6697 Transcript_3504/m.6697 type:complete len:619 (-) Transcript_3504:88-1944(-)